MGLDVGQVRDPRPVGRGGCERALDEVARAQRVLRGDRRLPAPAPSHAAEAELAHQALDGAARDADPLAVELDPDLVGAVDAAVVGMDPGDLVAQGAVTLPALAQWP